MSLMQDLFVGVSGLNASQRAINATAHNLSNVETNGFVRQQTVLDSSHYTTVGTTANSLMQVGIGVDTEAVYQVRDVFLDKAYRQENGRQGFYEVQSEAVSEIENLFGELQGVAFQDSLESFWTSLQEMAKEPDSLVTRASLVETAVSFMERAENIADQLNAYQLDLNTQIETMVNRINEIGTSMTKLNDQIAYYEANGVENANDLRDQRNQLLDELSQMVKISYNEVDSGRVTVNVEGYPFVTEDTMFKMTTVGTNEIDKYQQNTSDDTDTEIANVGSNMLIPVWPAYGYINVCNISQVTSAASDTDIGSLRGLLITRGDKVGRYTDIPIEPKEEDYTDDAGVLDETAYDEALGTYKQDLNTYRLQVEQSVVVSAQAQFDTLIHGIVTTINDILSPNKEVTLSDGTKVKILDEENAPVGIDEDASMGEALFNRKSMARYQEPQELVLEDGSIITARVYNEESESDNYSLFTIGEIEVNTKIKDNQSVLPLSSNTGTGDYAIEICNMLVDAWQEPFATLSPDTLTKCNFDAYYNEFIGGIATRGDELNTISENQQVMTENIDEQRLSVTGVSSDEELTNLIKFQHSYSAASRYINVVDEMLATLMEKM